MVAHLSLYDNPTLLDLWLGYKAAVRTNNMAEIDRLLTSSPRIHSFALSHAIETSDSLMTEILLTQYHLPVAKRPNDIESPLRLAVRTGAPDIVALLLDHGADHTLQETGSGSTCLHSAIDTENLTIVDILLAHGADPSIENYFGVCCLSAAAKAGNLPILHRLIQSPTADINRISPSSHMTPLLNSVIAGMIDTTRLLLEHRADANLHTSIFCPPLFYAIDLVEATQTQIVEALLVHGADPNLFNFGGCRPLHTTILCRNFATALVLINHGADPFLRDYTHRTALTCLAHVTASKTKHESEPGLCPAVAQILSAIASRPLRTLAFQRAVSLHHDSITVPNIHVLPVHLQREVESLRPRSPRAPHSPPPIATVPSF